MKGYSHEHFLNFYIHSWFCMKARERERKKKIIKKYFHGFCTVCCCHKSFACFTFISCFYFLSLSPSLFSIWIFLCLFTCASTDTLLFLILLFDHLEQQSVSSPSCLPFMSSMSKPPPIISLWMLLCSGLLPTHLPAHPSACQTTHQPGTFLRIDSELWGKKTQEEHSQGSCHMWSKRLV